MPGSPSRLDGMSEPRGHHLLAKLYQRGFASKHSTQVSLVVKASSRQFTCSIQDAFKRRDWNAFEDEDGERRQDFEKLLAHAVDGPAAAGFDALRAGIFPLPRQEREGVGRFIAAQLLRGRYAREATETFVDEVSQRILSVAAQNASDAWWEARGGRAPTGKERKDFIHGKVARPSPRKPALDATAGLVDDLAPLILDRTWLLIEFPGDCLFTSEAPIWLSGPGLAYADEIRVPLTPKLVLCLVDQRKLGGSQLAERKHDLELELAGKVNLGTLRNPQAETLLLAPGSSAMSFRSTKSAGRYRALLMTCWLALISG